MAQDNEQSRQLRSALKEFVSNPFKHFLHTDVGSVYGCEQFLSAIQEVRADGTQVRNMSGNVFIVRIKPHGVTVENMWDESAPILEYSLEEFESLLLSYLERLKSEGRG